MTRPSARGGAPILKGRHVLFALIGFFLVVFAANGVMIYLAISTFGGLDTPDAYRKGLAYNERVAAAEAQAKLGWRDSLAYVPETRRLRVALAGPDGAAVSGLAVTAHLQRPATDRFDRELVLEPTAPGTYEADTSGLEAGWWTVDLEARRERAAQTPQEATLFASRRRLWIKP
ncbi:MAG TPA: FixH family protein [Hyphomicrobium sp.]